MDGGSYPSKPMSAYAKSWTTIISRSRQKSTTRCMKSRSTQAPVGLCGNEMTRTRGFGQPTSHAFSRLAKKSPVKSSLARGSERLRMGTWRRSAPANSGP